MLILKSIWHGNSSAFKSIKHDFFCEWFINVITLSSGEHARFLSGDCMSVFFSYLGCLSLTINLIVCIRNCQSVNKCSIEPWTCQSSNSLWWKAQHWRYVTTSISLWKFPVKCFPVFAESAIKLCILYNTLNIMHFVWSLWIYAYSNWPMILFSKGYYRVFGSGADSLTDWMHSRGEFNLPEIDSLCVCQCFPAVSYHFIVFSAFLQYLHYESV